MPELLQYDFITRALLLGTISAITTAILGNFIVAGRQSAISDMLAHTALAGVGLGILLNISPNITAIIISIIASTLLYTLGKQKKFSSEAISMLLLSTGLALAILFVDISPNKNISLDTFLFGSILTINKQEALYFTIINLTAIATIFTFWNRFLATTFNSDFIKNNKKKTNYYELLLIIITGIIVATSLKIIGGLLVGALLVISVLSAQITAKSFKQSLILSIFFNITGVAAGISFSYYLDIPSSSSIVLTLVVIFIIRLLSSRK